MSTYLIRRIFLIIPTMFLVSVLVFFSIRFIPGDVITMMARESFLTHQDRASIEHSLGLDVPIYQQYGRWVGKIILHGDLGHSLWGEVPVFNSLSQALPVTFELSLLSMIIGIIISLPIGVYSAIRQDSVGDYIARSFAILCIALPTFWLGTMVMVLPALWWGWSPPLIYVPFTKDPANNLVEFLVPAIILGMSLSGVTMRMTRTMVLEVLRQDFIRTAWAKGLKERVVILRHALKNALIPVITIIGLQVPFLIGGAVIVEQIFGLPGVGRLIIDATFQRDYPVVSGVVLIIAVFVLIVNLLVDITYGLFDPRVHYR
ncbi:MAG: ABC transporter permease [Dehalococcoidales bacterium]|nr:ABC transporter permease [Dehalococcoidales bacterium]